MFLHLLGLMHEIHSYPNRAHCKPNLRPFVNVCVLGTPCIYQIELNTILLAYQVHYLNVQHLMSQDLVSQDLVVRDIIDGTCMYSCCSPLRRRCSCYGGWS